jgi:hypothetical protein
MVQDAILRNRIGLDLFCQQKGESRPFWQLSVITKYNYDFEAQFSDKQYINALQSHFNYVFYSNVLKDLKE